MAQVFVFLTAMSETLTELLPLAWLHSRYGAHLGSEPAYDKSLYFSPSLCFD